MSDIFWASKPSILFERKGTNIKIWPSADMHYVSKLNAVTRLTIILTILGYMYNQSSNILIVGVVTIILILLIHMYYKKTGKKITALFQTTDTSSFDDEENGIEGFSMSPSTVISNPVTLKKHLRSDFSKTTSKNPLSNVLLTDIHDDPEKKSAPPAFQGQVYGDINNATKQMVKDVNEDHPNIDKKLFGTLGENFDFDRNMRQFHSTANTRVVNDQGAFANYLYGNMPSCKEGDVIQCSANNQRYTNY